MLNSKYRWSDSSLSMAASSENVPSWLATELPKHLDTLVLKISKQSIGVGDGKNSDKVSSFPKVSFKRKLVESEKDSKHGSGEEYVINRFYSFNLFLFVALSLKNWFLQTEEVVPKRKALRLTCLCMGN